MYDFQLGLVINTNLPPILHRFRDRPIAFDPSIGQNRYNLATVPLLRLTPRRRGSLYHVIVSDILLKLKN